MKLRTVGFAAACFAIIGFVSGVAHGQTPRARLVGAFWAVSQHDAERSADEWREDLDRIQSLGMDLIVLTASFAKPSEHGAEPMQGLFDETDRRGMRVFANTLSLPNWWAQQDTAPEIARAEGTIRDIARVCGGRKSFAGWYVPYELYMFWGGQAELIRTLYRDVSARCKAAADKPVMISPFFILDKAQDLGDFRWAGPAEYQAFWTDVLKQSSIDIVALQDSGEHLSCYTLDDRRPFFAAMKGACDAAGKTLWANVETGELDVKSVEDYVARFGRKTHVNDVKLLAYWRGVPAAKLAQKLELAGQFASTAITWGYQEYVRPGAKPESGALFESYLELGLNSK